MKSVSAGGNPLKVTHGYALLEALGNPKGKWYTHPLQFLVSYDFKIQTWCSEEIIGDERLDHLLKNLINLYCDREIVQDPSVTPSMVLFKNENGEVAGRIVDLKVPSLPMVDEVSW